MANDAEAAPEIVGELRAVCLALPEAHEEPAWVGTRWRIRTKTFAHVLRVADGYPPAYARVVPAADPLTIVTFRAPAEEAAALGAGGRPFFLPGWWSDIVGLELDGDTDWADVAELLTTSYRLLAPKRLAALVEHER